MKSSKFILIFILTSTVLLNKTINGQVLQTQNDNQKTDTVDKSDNNDDKKESYKSQQGTAAPNSPSGNIHQVS